MLTCNMWKKCQSPCCHFTHFLRETLISFMKDTTKDYTRILILLTRGKNCEAVIPVNL